MLYVTKGIRLFLEEMAAKKQVNLGSLMIQIISKWAWENGFTCDHPYKKIFSPPPNKTWRCLNCGATLTEGALMRDGSRILGRPEYPIVGFVVGE